MLRPFLFFIQCLCLSIILLSPAALAQQPQSGGTLVVAADSEQRNYNPALIASNGVFYVASKVIEPLYDMGRNGTLEPRLALSHAASSDGLSIRFTLRPNVMWHDGKPFTSADVAFSALHVWKKLQNIGRSLLIDLEAVETPDELTAVFKFSKPIAPDLIVNALPAISSVLPKHLYEGSDISQNPANTKLVGTGPFLWDSHQPNISLKLVRNPHYWDAGKPYLNAIIYKALPDKSAIAASLEAGEIQLAAFSAVPLNDLERLSKVKGVSVVREGYDGITYQLTVEINHRRKELADVRVRRAIQHAIDANFITKVIFLNTAKASNGPVPAFDKRFFDASLKAPAFDRAAANRLLDEAGYKRDARGVRFSVKLLPAPWFEQTKQFGTYLKQALKAVGIEVEIVSNDAAAHIKAVYTDFAFDLAIGSPVYRNDPAISTTLLYQSGLPAGVPFSNQYGYVSQQMDALIAKGRSAVNREERVRIYKAFQKLALDDLPILHIAEFTFISVARNTVKNVGNNPRWATSHWADTWLQRP